MNILQEEEHSNNNELQQCKLNYLQEESQWMIKEQEFINDLIFKYKQLIALNGDPQSKDKLEEIRKEIKKDVQNKHHQYDTITKEKRQIEEDISDDEFFTLVGSFQEKIIALQQNIKDRETQLQSIEVEKSKEVGVRRNKIDFRYLGSVETNGKLIQKVKNEVSKLKLQKKKLENQLLLQKEGQIAPGRLSSQKKLIIKEDEEMSIFEKVVMMIKKKKFVNEVLEQKVKKLKNKINSKKAINDSLKKEIQRLEWGCFQNMQSCNGYMDSSYAAQDISIFDRTFINNNNISFSFDVSRFIRPK